MIQVETLTINNRNFTRTYSDMKMKIRKDGTDEIYDEAIDPADSGRTYTETDEPIETSEADAEEIVDILTGGES